MDFRNSGLPQDPTVFKAFMTYMQNTKELPEEVRDTTFPLRSAQMLGATSNDNAAATVALLQVMPPATWGVVEKNFGKDTVAALNEFHRHNSTNYAYLREASPLVKQLTMAGAILTFDDFQKITEKVDQQIETLMMNGTGNLSLPMMPDASMFDKMSNAVLDTSGAPALEEMFMDKLYTFKSAQQDFQQKLEQLGIQIPGMGIGFAPADVRYPSFEETELFDSAKVRTAYETIINHTRTMPEDFEAALSVGRLLSTVSPSVNPTSVAVALLDVGIPGMGRGDLEFMKNRFDWDVLEVLNTASVHQLMVPQQILKAPVEFRQVALADAIVKLEDAQKAGQHILDVAEQTPDVPKGALHQNFMELKRFGKGIEQMFKPVIGKTDVPELDTLFESKLKVFFAFTDMHLPQQEAPAPKPQDPKADAKNKPKPPGMGGGASFSF